MYEAQTAPLVGTYTYEERLVMVDGTGSIDEVADNIVRETTGLAATAAAGRLTTRERRNTAMPMYRLRLTSGSTRPITAGRVVVDGDQVRFQSPGTGGWVTVDSAPLADVAQLDRKVNEAGGLLRWVPERGVNAAAEVARPDTPTEQPPAAPEPPGTVKTAAVRQPEPVVAVSARDIRCPQCGEQEALSGRRVDGEVFLTCQRCTYDGPRVARRTCPTCGGDDLVDRPRAVVERSRGTQLSVVGYTTVTLCKTCDAGTVAAALAHGGAVMPTELPTVDPQTLRDLGRTRSRE